MVKQDVPDYLAPGLNLVIVGINPGIRSGSAGHHYAFAGNHFWRLLYEAELLPEPIGFADDHRVLEFGIGLTNLVHRTSRSASDLTRAEMAAGAEELKEKLRQIRPHFVSFNGMGIYAAFSGRSKVSLGLQEEDFDGLGLFVTPSSSGRTAAYQWDVKLRCYRDLKALLDRV